MRMLILRAFAFKSSAESPRMAASFSAWWATGPAVRDTAVRDTAVRLIGADLCGRRTGFVLVGPTHRSGYLRKHWDTRAGSSSSTSRNCGASGYFPSFLEPRGRSEQALLNVVQHAYVCRVSTRR